jgi:hypothetical protein
MKWVKPQKIKSKIMKHKKFLHTQFVKFINEKYKSNNINENDEETNITDEETNITDDEIINDVDNKKEEDDFDEVDLEIIKNKKFPEYEELNVDKLIEEYNNLQKRYKAIYGSVYKRK